MFLNKILSKKKVKNKNNLSRKRIGKDLHLELQRQLRKYFRRLHNRFIWFRAVQKKPG